MRHIILLLILVPLAITAQVLKPTQPVRFLALGDSYTIGESVPSAQNWPHQLMDSLSNRGMTTDTLRIIATTGWRTDNLINAITNQNLQAQNYNLVSVLIGVNNQYQNRPFSQYVTEFPQLMDSALRYAGGDKQHVFVVSIPDYAYTPFGQQNGSAATISTQLDQYNAFAQHYADSIGVAFIDITPISRQGLADTALVAGDGLHPSAKQYSLWVHEILKYIDSTNTTTGVMDPSQVNIKVYPNPANDFLNITIPTDWVGNAHLEIYESSGRKILERTLSGTRSIVPIDRLPKDVYFIKVEMDGKRVIDKLVKD